MEVKKIPCEICGMPIRPGQKMHTWTHKNKLEKEEALANNSPDVPEQLREKLQCDECGQSFNFRCVLNKHKERHHKGDKERKLELCPECGGSYLELQSHLRYAHTKTEGQKTWECLEPGCGKKFRMFAHLNRHKKMIHLKLKPFQCAQCPRSFGTLTNYKRHIDSHLGIRPYKCEFCPSAFITRSAVNTHKRIFHEEGSTPKRKSYVRGPTMLGVDETQEELRKKGMYCPPSLAGNKGKGSKMGGSWTGAGSSGQDNTEGYDHDGENEGGDDRQQMNG